MYTLVENLYQVYSYQIADTPRPFLSVIQWQQPISFMSGLGGDRSKSRSWTTSRLGHRCEWPLSFPFTPFLIRPETSNA